jgi:hypothetical protein
LCDDGELVTKCDQLKLEARNKLTDYWSDHGIEKRDEFAILTNIIHKELK